MNIYPYFKFPDEKDWANIETKSNIRNLLLEVELDNKNDISSFFRIHEFNNWLNLLNNKFGELRMTYVFLIYYYNSGIPDKEWKKSPGNHGESIQYFPNFTNENFINKMMFDYYSDIFYYKFFSSWDTIFHLFNIFYDMNINKSIGFSNKVIAILKEKNINFYRYINEMNHDKIISKAVLIRNNLTHNFPPNEIKSITNISKSNNLIQYSFGGSEYTPSNEIQENIDSIINLYLELLTKLKNEFEKLDTNG